MYIFVVATAGEEGRKCLMREIELGKLIGENVSPNIVKFMGCVTTESKCLSVQHLFQVYVINDTKNAE